MPQKLTFIFIIEYTWHGNEAIELVATAGLERRENIAEAYEVLERTP